MLAILAPILVFGIVIFVHELGHFLAAKAAGVYTPRFSIGFGPALWRRRKGETEYILAAFPLGGYVRMASREDEATAFLEGGSEKEAKPGEELDPDAMIPFGPKPIPADRWIESKPLLARLAILLAGVTMNALLALVVTTGMFAYYGAPYAATTVDSLLIDRPAIDAGMRVGDSIAAVDGIPVESWEQLVTRIGASAGVPVAMDVVRQGERRRIVVTPLGDTVRNPATGELETLGRIGIVPRQGARSISPVRAVVEGWSATWRMAGVVIDALHGLATRRVSTSELGGPIMIATVSVQAARGGMEQLLFLLALISINLAVFNLLPIPILDGGHILIALLEAAKGSEFSLRTRELILRAGLFAILLLFALVTYNDIRRLLASLVERFA